ncbi:hypothetical protein [Agromyces sp. CCNWLW203]|uniref:hypothetical protein n=1 Tax=Agromyces sp. CCNWLW203 TaxID=3112842 RepID=UPI002F9649DE
MTTLTNGTDVISPTAIDGWGDSSEHGNIVHRIIGSEDVDVVLRPATLATGTMSLVIPDDAAALAARNALRSAAVWTIAHDRGVVDMTFVVTGRVTRDIDTTRAAWLVGFSWQEVAP